jgi:diacylglycerol kinase family enzyme
MVNNRLSCHLAGLGFDAQVAHSFARRKKRGINTYISEVIKNFFSIKNYIFSIEIDGKKLNEEAFCICITNSNQFGNNFKIAPKASISDGLLDVVIFRKSVKVTALISLAKQVFSGKIKSVHSKNLDNKKVLYFQTKELFLTNDHKAPLHIDGDPFDTEKKFHIKILPGAYRLLQPGN